MLNFTYTNAYKNRGINIFLYGASGVGKTTMVKTAPNPIIVSAESGLLSVQDTNIPVLEISEWEDFLEALNWLNANQNIFDTIFIDSITEIAEIYLKKLQQEEKDGRKAYARLANDIVNICRTLRDSFPSKNVILVSKQEQETVDNQRFYTLSFPGKASINKVPYLFDEVFALRIIKDEQTQQPMRVIQTFHDGFYEGKDRSGKLAPYEIPNFTYLINKMKGITTENTAESGINNNMEA